VSVLDFSTTLYTFTEIFALQGEIIEGLELIEPEIFALQGEIIEGLELIEPALFHAHLS
jgi:hypothetical protein